MKRTCLIVVLSLMFVGCYEVGGDSSQFNWAVVDKRILENEIQKLAKKNNPYPDGMAVDKVEYSRERSSLSGKINKIKSDLIKKCMTSPSKPEIEKKPYLYPEDGRGLAESMGMYSYDHDTRGKMPMHDQACKDQVDSDPLVIELKKRLEKLSSVENMRYQHDRRVKEVSRNYVQKLIDQYAKQKYEVILSKANSTILFNAKGIEIDATQALISAIDKSELVLPKDNQGNRGF